MDSSKIVPFKVFVEELAKEKVITGGESQLPCRIDKLFKGVKHL